MAFHQSVDKVKKRQGNCSPYKCSLLILTKDGEKGGVSNSAILRSHLFLGAIDSALCRNCDGNCKPILKTMDCSLLLTVYLSSFIPISLTSNLESRLFVIHSRRLWLWFRMLSCWQFCLLILVLHYR